MFPKTIESLDCMPAVWRRVEWVAGILESHAPSFNKLTHQDLTDIRDDLNEAAEAVQTLRDKIDWDAIPK